MTQNDVMKDMRALFTHVCCSPSHQHSLARSLLACSWYKIISNIIQNRMNEEVLNNDSAAAATVQQYSKSFT